MFFQDGKHSYMTFRVLFLEKFKWKSISLTEKNFDLGKNISGSFKINKLRLIWLSVMKYTRRILRLNTDWQCCLFFGNFFFTEIGKEINYFFHRIKQFLFPISFQNTENKQSKSVIREIEEGAKKKLYI